MKFRVLLSVISVLLISIATAFGQNNSISIPDVSVAKGKSINLPVNLDNSVDVVGVQFTLTVPEGFSLNTLSASMSERADGHTVTFQNIAANKYMAMIFSSENKAIKGRTGKLMSIRLEASSVLEEGSQHSLSLSEVVIGARDGSDLTTGFSAGKITIAQDPDLEVSQVVSEQVTISPLGRINVNWTVTNVGGLPTTGGWREQILLKDESGVTKLLGTLYQDEPLGVDGLVSRNAEFNLPAIIGMDGNCQIVVKLVPNSDSGEPSWLLENNIAETHTSVSVQKIMTLSPESANIEEVNAKNIRFQLSRSGNTDKEEVFTLTQNVDSRILLPETITITKGQSSTFFYAQVIANQVLDNDSIVNVAISGNDYPEVSTKIHIEDDTYPSLSATVNTMDVVEGGSLVFTITTQRASKSDIKIKMISDHTSRFKIPSNIFIPAGQKSIEVTVEATDDDVPNAEENVAFTISAPRHNPANAYIILADNDVPTLQMEITPNAISEAAGPLSITAKLRRTDNIDKVVTVKLSDDSFGGIYYGHQTIIFEKGVEEVTVNLGPIDNGEVDGERTYMITAAVWVASCSCNASNGTSGGMVTVPLTVYDNDGPTLTISSSASILKEGGEMIATIKRNTGTQSSLVVYLSSDHDADIEYPASVVIPAGAAETSFVVKSKENKTSGDNFTAMLSVSTEGFATGNIWFNVSDQTLPDAQIDALSFEKDSYSVQENIKVELSLSNKGNASLPTNTAVTLYDVNNKKVALAFGYTKNAIEAGETSSLFINIVASKLVGNQSIYAVINESKTVPELNYNNNSSALATINIQSPFTFTAALSKSIYSQGENIVIRGKAIGAETSNMDIDVYIINKGYRHVLKTQTDENGEYEVSYKTFENQSGHFIVGACYPDEKATEELCAFDIYGMSVHNNSLTCDVLKGTVFNGSFTIRNEGNLSLHNIKARLLNYCDEDTKISLSPSSINLNGEQNATIEYTIEGSKPSSELKWTTVNVEFSSDEGISKTANINYYIREPKAKLNADVVNLNTSLALGTDREFVITLTNIGKSETGKVTLAAPDWITIANTSFVNTIASGESVTLALLISSNDKMTANLPVSGHIGFNCENGDGISIPFNIEPVFSLSGTLSIDVCDEFTYYTEEAPHVYGAKVIVRHPTTGTIIAQGETDDKGLFNVDLPAGYYAVSVTAEKHDTYNNKIYVAPERTKKVIVNLGYTAITYSWVVEETEIEDEYSIKAKVVYETNVPVPCVILGMPERIDGDNMRAGESTLVIFTVTNKGLITALNVNVNMPENTDEWKFEPLISIDPFDLPAQQAVAIPVRITRLIDEQTVRPRMLRAASPRANIVDHFQNCMAHVSADYEALCGEELKNNKALERMALKMCGVAATGATIFDAIASILPSGAGTGGGGNGAPTGDNNSTVSPDEHNPVISEQVFNMCDTCDTSKAEKIIDFLLGKTWLGPANDALNMAAQSSQDMRDTGHAGTRMKLTQHAFEQLQDRIREQRRERVLGETGASVVGWVDDIIEVIDIITEECPTGNSGESDSGSISTRSNSVPEARASSHRSWQEDYNNVALRTADYLKNYDKMLQAFFGDQAWYLNDSEETKPLFSLLTTNENVTIEQAMAVKPQFATKEMVERIMERIYNTVNDVDSENRIHWNDIDECVNVNNEIQEESIKQGFESLADQYQRAYDTCIEKYKELSSSVCASITLQFSQKMVMTRQAFRGTLSVFNGHENLAMKDVKLTLSVKDLDGKETTSHELQIITESLEGFASNPQHQECWELDAQQTGVAKILFIPTKYAAPTVEKRYSFGGTLSYVDPFTSLSVTRTLTPVILTIKPSPNLDLTYFMQRDIKGDDPLTEEIEASEEAEFSLLINNTGYGDATDVKMFTEQPKIIDNEKGLKIDFELISSQLNGGNKTLALGGTVATDFGTIPAMSTSYAQWWIKSSLLGHFTDYNVEATHVTSFGNPDLSLLNEVSIHELIRSIDVEDGVSKLVGFMTNDIADAEDTPDMLYLSNGEIESVSLAGNVEIQRLSETDYSLKVNRGKMGWNYGSVADPTYGIASLKSVVRQRDGKELSLRNFWQTDRTLRDGKDPLYENRIHFVDEFASTDEMYILTFEPMPELLLEVASIEGVPEEGCLSVEPVNTLKVIFNKYIDPSSFTTEDFSLAVQGVKQDLSTVAISTEDNKTFYLDFSNLNENVGNGYFVLSINTSEIKDFEGYNGKNGKSAGWIMFRDGLVALKTATYPSSAGSVIMMSSAEKTRVKSVLQSVDGCAEYGSTVTFAIVPNEGYEFKNWTINGEEVSNEPNFEYLILGDMDVKANFTLKTYSIEIKEPSEGGAITGAASGIYSFDEVLQLSATETEDFVFDGWLVNGQNFGKNSELTVTVNEAKVIDALFTRNVFQQPFTVLKGWNWISSYMNEPILVGSILGNVTHIIGQFDEIINDPVYGMVGGIETIQPGVAYKIDASYSALKSFKGHLHDTEAKPVVLHTGWNWISYPYYEEKNINDVIANATEGDYITSQVGFSEFANGYWAGTLNNLIPGMGYIYKSSSDKTLTFDFSEVRTRSGIRYSDTYREDFSQNVIDVHKYPSTMNVIARLSNNGYDDEESGYKIYAFSGNECRGMSHFVEGCHYLTIYGDNAENITFVVENENTGETYMTKDNMTFSQEVVGRRNAPYILTINGFDMNDSSRKMHIYNVEGILIHSNASMETLKHLSSGIYFVDGQKFIVK